MSDITTNLYGMSKVNLDALIPRADFIETSLGGSKTTFSEIILPHLEKDGISSLYNVLRKPDFQRETNEWDKVKILDIIEGFMKGSFIPAVIVWKSPANYIFVIDGAHRISALIAYIIDDYGDRETSQKYFDYNIPDEELALADECRKYIEKKIGSFQDIVHISKNEASYSEEDVIKARRFIQFSLKVQEIQNATVTEAEMSFFKINEQGVALSPTEKRLCFARYKPNCITTRAIMKAGKGNPYWKDFTADNQALLKTYAEEINTLMFKPPLMTPAKSHEFFPMGGKYTSAMPMVFDFVNMVSKKTENEKVYTTKLADDKNGDETIKYLKRVRKAVWLINSADSSSLGLHPLVYFYTSTGAHQQTALLSLTQVMLKLEVEGKLPYFIKIRSRFEEFIIKYKIFVAQIIRRYGSKRKSDEQLKAFYHLLIVLIQGDFPEQDILKNLKSTFDVLNESESELEKTGSPKFSTEVSNSKIIALDLEGCKRCEVCGGRIQHRAVSKDHIIKVENGGTGNFANLDITHPYCNSGYKNWLEHKEKLSHGKG